MKKCFYFAENQKKISEAACMMPGFGFTADGLWRGIPLPMQEGGLLIDDRHLPNPSGIAAACRSLADWTGLIVLDFERKPAAPLAALARALSGKRVILPPSYAKLPHAAVLIGPWQGEAEFSRWLSQRRACYRHVVLDAMPLRVQCFPGGRRTRWRQKLPESGYPCPALGCLHRRLPDGSFLFWDTRQTLSARLAAAGVSAILFESDWLRLLALPETL